jgi:two-component system CheB/CheR fusion protein
MTDIESAGPRSEPRASQKLLVVGLGASAGGIEVLRRFFTHVPRNSGSAYVVILHLSPDHDSKLAEVLQVTASIPVTQVSRTVALEADHVYVVPPNRKLEFTDGMLTPTEMSQREHRRSPVDLFFGALADSHGSRSVGVVLSGTGANGSAGLKRIKEYGGLAIAQATSEAPFADMPSNAIATGVVDLVLPVAEMPGRIADFAARLQDVPAPSDVNEADVPDALHEVLGLLRVRTGHDFGNYKRGTVIRRMQRRMHVVGVDDISAYGRLIRENPDEGLRLLKDLLISVTHFFRDHEVFAALEARVIPRLFEAKSRGDQLRVWVPGCATGEEAYSIAMLLCEQAEGRSEAPPMQIFATDLDEAAIASAREGLYSEADVAELPDGRLDRFFHREGTGFRVRRDLRELTLFAHHNVIKDPPFSHLDLISCRNLLIYLNRAAQERVLETFHFALRPSALLMLGPSESPDGFRELFTSYDRPSHTYQSRLTTSRATLSHTPVVTVPRAVSRVSDTRPVERFAPIDAHHRLLEAYAPPSLIVSDDHTVVHMSERAARYLQLSAGEPSRDLMKLVRPELRADLRMALYQAATARTSIEVRDVLFTFEGTPRHITLTVRPALRDDEVRGFFLVLFADEGEADNGRTARPLDSSEPMARHLEDELARVKTQLRTSVEQYEAQVEEAQASAEEQQAMNEELRSSAEELETSQEELQSVNEELTTVNQELKIKIEELRLSNSDFQNLINSTDVATIFLDRSLRLKLMTPRAQDIFNVIHTDIGRPLSDITNRLVDDRLNADLRQALQELHAVDREVMIDDGRWFLMRVRPYRTSDDRIDGIVLMFQDISSRHSAEAEVKRSEERLRLLIDSAIDYAIFTMTADGRIDSWNTGAQRLFGYAADEVIGRGFEILFTPEDRATGAPAAELERAQRDGRAFAERAHVRRDGTFFLASGVTTRLGNTTGLGFATIARDLTPQQRAAEALRQAHLDANQRVEDRTREMQASIEGHQSSEASVFNLLRKLVTAQEDERGRIARNLHDQLGQRVTAMRLSLERTRDRLTQTGHHDDDLERALELTHMLDADVGFISSELRPAVLDQLGLAAALPRYVQEWSEHYGVEVAYRGDDFQTGRLSREAEVAMYRIAQEALTNIARHAHASRVDILLELRDQVVMLVIEDDGIGFDPDDRELTSRGVGLLGMRERAGLIGAEFLIESGPADGTSIYLRVPIATGP